MRWILWQKLLEDMGKFYKMWQKLLQDVGKCRNMWENVPKCVKMWRDVGKCYNNMWENVGRDVVSPNESELPPQRRAVLSSCGSVHLLCTFSSILPALVQKRKGMECLKDRGLEAEKYWKEKQRFIVVTYCWLINLVQASFSFTWQHFFTTRCVV